MPKTTLYDGRARKSATWSSSTSCSPRRSTRRYSTRSSPPSSPVAEPARTTPRRAARSAAAARSRTARRAPAAPARASIRSPHYRGGGVVFGPHPRSYEQRLPRKMKRLALRGALTAKLGDDAIRVVDTFGLEAIRTRDLVGVLDALDGRPVASSSSRPAGREPRPVGAQPARRRSHSRRLAQRRVDLLNADTVVIEQPALAQMEEVYA